MGFLRKMIRQSAHYSVKNTVLWFTTLVSKDRWNNVFETIFAFCLNTYSTNYTTHTLCSTHTDMTDTPLTRTDRTHTRTHTHMLTCTHMRNTHCTHTYQHYTLNTWILHTHCTPHIAQYIHALHTSDTETYRYQTHIAIDTPHCTAQLTHTLHCTALHNTLHTALHCTTHTPHCAAKHTYTALHTPHCTTYTHQHEIRNRHSTCISMTHTQRTAQHWTTELRTHTHLHIHTHAHTHTHTLTHSHTYTRSHTHTHTHTYTLKHTFTHSNLDETYRLLEAADGLVEHRTVEMEHGQKKSRIVAWTFLDELARQKWFR